MAAERPNKGMAPRRLSTPEPRGQLPLSRGQGMGEQKAHATEVWAGLDLSRRDRDRIADFLAQDWGVAADKVVWRMHLTVYYARRPMPGVEVLREPAHVVLPAADTRFMVMAPGGENPRQELDPGRRKVGLRVRRQSQCFAEIMSFRERLLSFETQDVLGSRAPSSHKSNAFGARHFQAHMSVLLAGSEVPRDLSPLGTSFRETFDELIFDQFRVTVRQTGRGQ